MKLQAIKKCRKLYKEIKLSGLHSLSPVPEDKGHSESPIERSLTGGQTDKFKLKSCDIEKEE